MMAKKRKRKARSSSIEPLHSLVGCVRDRRISEKVGVSVPAVSRYRSKHSIESFNQNMKDVQAVLGGGEASFTALELQKQVHARREALSDPSRSDKKVPIALVEAVLGLYGMEPSLLAEPPSQLGKRLGQETEVIEDVLASFSLPGNGRTTRAPLPQPFSQASMMEKKAFLLKAREDGVEHVRYALASSLSEAAVIAEEAQAQGLIRGKLFEIREVGDAVG
jgi:hypothetical protein